MVRPFAQCRLVLLLAVLAGSAARDLAAADNPAERVEFEIFTTGRVSAGTQQAWAQTLSKLSVKGLQIRAGKAADKPAITTVGKKHAEVFHVVGSLNERGELSVPGGRFTSRDGAAIIKWMGTLGDHGVAGVTEKKSAFGLTERQLTDVQKDLEGTVDFRTKGEPATKVVERLAKGTLRVTIDPALAKALARDEPVRDEFFGLSRGTALAALVRPAGGVLVPRKPAGADVELWLTDGKQATELWPIGWTTDEQLTKQAPKMMETLNAEIDGVSAAEAIAAIQPRVELPFLYDYNGLALKEIDLTKPVKTPPGKTYYHKLLRDILSRAGCKHEVRVDENNRPFVWITVK